MLSDLTIIFAVFLTSFFHSHIIGHFEMGMVKSQVQPARMYW